MTYKYFIMKNKVIARVDKIATLTTKPSRGKKGRSKDSHNVMKSKDLQFDRRNINYIGIENKTLTKLNKRLRRARRQTDKQLTLTRIDTKLPNKTTKDAQR